ncbi:MAG: hypothetical protein WC423_06915 [Vulcanimicrobiota bacterium]
MKSRGSILIGVLLLITLLFILGMASLSRSVARQRTLAEAREFAQARQLARAGLADVQTKLARDITFPPPIQNGHQLFSYTEPVRAFDDTILGYYTITLDGRWSDPYQIYRIRSVGKTGLDPAQPKAEVMLETEFDLAEFDRGSGAPNPYFYDLRVWLE